MKSVLEQILAVARWAPSADNTQPWRFEITSPTDVIIHGFDTSSHCVYDLDGHLTHIGLGALLESISVAASGHCLRVTWKRRVDTPSNHCIFDVHLNPDDHVVPDPLIPAIPRRTVQRRSMKTRALSLAEKAELQAAAGPDHRIIWLEGFRNKLRVATLMFHHAKLRLTMPEAYQTHKEIIEWNVRFSQDRIPDQAVGLDPILTRLMGWVLQSWKRVDFFNRYLGGTWLARLEMDLLPGLACGAHFVILAQGKPKSTDDFVQVGQVAQRFWLTATRLDLKLQPESIPLVFARYLREGIHFSAAKGMTEGAQVAVRQLGQLIGEEAVEYAVFIGRIGEGREPIARSVRLPMERLLIAR